MSIRFFFPSVPMNDVFSVRDPGAYQSRIMIIFNGQDNYKEIYNIGFSYTFYRTLIQVLSW